MNQWYYGEAGQQIGPVEGTEILRLKAEGRLTAESLVWREGMLAWQPIGQLSDEAFLAQQMAYYQATTAAAASGWAIASMVCGIVSLFMCYVNILCAIPAVVFGHMALSKIRNSAQPMSGRGMAIAGLVTGYLAILMNLATAAFFIYIFYQARSHHP